MSYCLGEEIGALLILGPRKLKKHFVSPVVFRTLPTPHPQTPKLSVMSNPFLFEDCSWLL